MLSHEDSFSREGGACRPDRYRFKLLGAVVLRVGSAGLDTLNFLVRSRTGHLADANDLSKYCTGSQRRL